MKKYVIIYVPQNADLTRTVIMQIEKETTGNAMLLERIFKAFEIKEKTHRQDLAKMRAITKKKAGE